MSNLSLERLLFDPTAPSDGPSVGSYLVSLGGNVITDTGSALDVNISSSDIDIQIDIDTSNFVADDEVFTENGMPIGYRAHDASSALSALSADGDKSDALSDLYRRLFINDAPNIAGSNEAVSVDTTAGGVALPNSTASTALNLNSPLSISLINSLALFSSSLS